MSTTKELTGQDLTQPETFKEGECIDSEGVKSVTYARPATLELPSWATDYETPEGEGNITRHTRTLNHSPEIMLAQDEAIFLDGWGIAWELLPPEVRIRIKASDGKTSWLTLNQDQIQDVIDALTEAIKLTQDSKHS